MPREALDPVLRGVALAATVVVMAALASCGGDDSQDTTAAGAGSGQAGSGQSDAGAESIETFGEAAGPDDRDAAAATVQELQRAWADGDSARACSLMSTSTKENLDVFAGQFAKSQACTEQVEALRSQIPAERLGLGDRLEVTGVRIEGENGYVLYRDARGTDSAFPVVREGSAWKVAAIAGQSLP
jgi:hypothetical protein